MSIALEKVTLDPSPDSYLIRLNSLSHQELEQYLTINHTIALRLSRTGSAQLSSHCLLNLHRLKELLTHHQVRPYYQDFLTLYALGNSKFMEHLHKEHKEVAAMVEAKKEGHQVLVQNESYWSAFMSKLKRLLPLSCNSL